MCWNTEKVPDAPNTETVSDIPKLKRCDNISSITGFLNSHRIIYWHTGQYHRLHRVASAYTWVPTQVLSVYPGDASESGSRVKVPNILEQK